MLTHFATLHFQKSKIFSGDITDIKRLKSCRLSTPIFQLLMIKKSAEKLRLMSYVLTPSEEVQIIAIILDWMNHKDYEKLFKF